jgi:hypothetical protein
VVDQRLPAVSPEIGKVAATVWSTSAGSGEVAGLHCGVLGERAGAGSFAQSEDQLAHTKAGGPVPQLHHDTRQLVAGYARRPVPARRGRSTLTATPARRGEPPGMDPHVTSFSPAWGS